MTDPSRALLFRLGAALAIADFFPLGELTMTCSAFTDGQHRYAYERVSADHTAEYWACACGRDALNASCAPELLTVNENTDFATLPFATGYNVEDYPLYLQAAALDASPAAKVIDLMVALKESIAPIRTIPPHACLWVQDGESDPNSGDYKERCTICPATRWQTLSDAEAERLAAEDSLVGETSAEWIRRMAHS